MLEAIKIIFRTYRRWKKQPDYIQCHFTCFYNYLICDLITNDSNIPPHIKDDVLSNFGMQYNYCADKTNEKEYDDDEDEDEDYAEDYVREEVKIDGTARIKKW